MDVEGILRVSGSTHQQKQLQKLYLKRKNPDLSQVGIHTVACLLKNYFRDCKDPLLSNQLYGDFLSLCMSSHRSLDSYPSGPRRERGKMRPFSCLFPSSLCSFVVLISLTDHFYFSLSLSPHPVNIPVEGRVKYVQFLIKQLPVSRQEVLHWCVFPDTFLEPKRLRPHEITHRGPMGTGCWYSCMKWPNTRKSIGCRSPI